MPSLDGIDECVFAMNLQIDACSLLQKTKDKGQNMNRNLQKHKGGHEVYNIVEMYDIVIVISLLLLTPTETSLFKL